jgi:hypothetical protein
MAPNPTGMMPIDPMVLLSAIRPPLSRFEPNQLDKARWLSDWLDTDEALSPENEPLRMAVEMLIEAHFMFGAEIATALAGAAGMAQQAQSGGDQGGGPPQKSQQQKSGGQPRPKPMRKAA